MPVVWLIDPYRAGERNQVLALAEALGWPFLIKRLHYRKYESLTNIFRGSDLRGIHRGRSDRLQEPWPDLVISSGLRNEPVCRWIRDQSAGRTRIVHVGNPWAEPSRFDLVVTTPQYRIPHRDNVVQNTLTLNSIDGGQLAVEAGRWDGYFSHLPGPFTVVVVGGNSGPFTFGARAALRLAHSVNRLQTDLGGSILLTTSARTDPRTVEVLRQVLRAPNFVYQWRPGDPANPYLGMLALAQQLVVTGDSISMLSEACATGKPVYLFDLGCGKFAMRPDSVGDWRDNDWRLGAVMYRLLMRFFWRKVSRDIRLVHRHLIDTGRAAWLPGDAPGAPETGHDMRAAVAAVRGLFEQVGSG